jgi:hypothetical protein
MLGAREKAIDAIEEKIKTRFVKDLRIDEADRKIAEAGGFGVIRLVYDQGMLRSVFVETPCKQGDQ